MEEDSDLLDKIGTIEILQELMPQCKMAYYALNNQESFKLITSFLVSENTECEKAAYQLLKLLI
jgi:hypothetical protein